MTFFAFSALLNFLTSILLTIIIYKKNFLYALVNLSIAFWSGFYFLWQISSSYQNALINIKLLTIGSILIPYFFYFFIITYFKLTNKIFKIILYYDTFLVFIFIFITISTN